MKKLLVTIMIVYAFSANAQRRIHDSNAIGISAGVNQTSVFTSDFDTKPGIGWNAGLSIRGNFYNDFDMVYAIQFSENNFIVETTSPILMREDVSYKLPSAQISLMGSYKIIDNHLSIEAGPGLQVNGKLSFDESNSLNLINGSTLLAGDIVEVNTFNYYIATSITGGIKNLRASVKYQYGINNLFGNLSDDMIGDLKANLGILSGNIIVYF